jgi:molybdopterin-guanine dinucleotide biosynthesis protein B
LNKIRIFKGETIKRLAIVFSGASGVGKTTFVLKIARNLIESGFKVAVVKHDPGDKARFDKEGKDSYRYSRLGADVAVVSPTRTSVFLKRGLFGGAERVGSEAHFEKREDFSNLNNSNLNRDLEELISHFGDFDYLLIEGLKFIPLPKIVIFRDEIKADFLPFASAVVSNLNYDFGVPAFGLEDVSGVIEWINNNAKKV